MPTLYCVIAKRPLLFLFILLYCHFGCIHTLRRTENWNVHIYSYLYIVLINFDDSIHVCAHIDEKKKHIHIPYYTYLSLIIMMTYGYYIHSYIHIYMYMESSFISRRWRRAYAENINVKFSVCNSTLRTRVITFYLFLFSWRIYCVLLNLL